MSTEEAQETNHNITAQEFLEQNPELRNEIMGGLYDNEWIKFLSEISKNSSVKDIVNFINSVYWSDRQKKTIMAYARVTLSDGLYTTYIRNYRDYQMALDDKALMDCNLMLGMTRFDITPEFNILIGMINLHFNLAIRNSVGGFRTKKIGENRHVIQHEENIREKDTGFIENAKKKLGWGE